ncbi:MAG: hypothetical protein AB1656_16055 [Candidatus Omnitrophota bacterium]
MTSPITLIPNDQKLSALDHDLPFLASEAAIDIDNLLANRGSDLTAIRLLSERLKNSIKLETHDDAPCSLMDRATLIVLGEAIAKSSKNYKAPLQIPQLLKEADGIANSLSKDNPTENQKELEAARDFCVALSRAAIAFQQSIFDLDIPPHPFRS